jgi:hypothetical protein
MPLVLKTDFYLNLALPPPPLEEEFKAVKSYLTLKTAYLG